MKYPNAFKGVKKIFTGELIELLGYVFLMVGTVVGMTGIAASEAGAGSGAVESLVIGSAVTLIPGLIMPLVGEVMVLLGLYHAGQDEPQYLRKAFLLSIASVVLTFITGLMMGGASEGGFLADVAELIAQMVSILVFIFTIQGFCKLAERTGSYEITTLGSKVLIAMVGSSVAALLTSIVADMASDTLRVTAGVASLVLSIAAYVMYLVFLSRVKETLARG